MPENPEKRRQQQNVRCLSDHCHHQLQNTNTRQNTRNMEVLKH